MVHIERARPRRFLGALLAALLLTAPALAGRQVHVLVMACTAYADPRHNEIGPSCELDRIRIGGVLDAYVREASWGIRLNRVELSGRAASRDGFWGAFDRIAAAVGETDTVLVYFTGHGVLDTATRRPYLLAADEQFIARDDIATRLQALRCKLRILLTDCCSSYLKVEVIEGDAEVQGDRELRSLLLEHTGFTDITAASPGQAAWATSQGGYFTNNLTSDILRFPTWKQVFAETRRRVAREVADLHGKVQEPYAASLAELDRAASAPAPAAEYAIPDSSVRRLSAEELRGMSLRQLYLARNEIFARHGYSFRTPFLQRHFSGTSWYRAAGDNAAADAALNDVERANVDILKSMELSMGGPLVPEGGGASFSYSSQRLIPRDVLQSLSLKQLSLARNEVYARHGYVFRSPALRAHFAKQPWYRPRSGAQPALTAVERANCAMIEKLERIKGGPHRW